MAFDNKCTHFKPVQKHKRITLVINKTIMMWVREFVPVSIATVNYSRDSVAEHEFLRSISQILRQRDLEKILVIEHIHRT